MKALEVRELAAGRDTPDVHELLLTALMKLKALKCHGPAVLLVMSHMSV